MFHVFFIPIRPHQVNSMFRVGYFLEKARGRAEKKQKQKKKQNSILCVLSHVAHRTPLLNCHFYPKRQEVVTGKLADWAGAIQRFHGWLLLHFAMSRVGSRSITIVENLEVLDIWNLCWFGEQALGLPHGLEKKKFSSLAPSTYHRLECKIIEKLITSDLPYWLENVRQNSHRLARLGSFFSCQGFEKVRGRVTRNIEITWCGLIL